MATSIQRIIAILVILDAVFIAANGFFFGANLTDIFNEQEHYTNTFWNNSDLDITSFKENTPDTSQIMVDKQYGDSTVFQARWTDILGMSLKRTYFGCTFEECDNQFESLIAWGISGFLAFLHLIGGLQIFYLIYSKKYD